MSPLGKTTTKEKKFSIKPYLLPAYIILSALFIIWVAYSYANNTIYGTGYQTGYQQAFLDVSAQSLTEQGCQSGVPINLGNNQSTVLVNTQCFQQQPEQTQSETPSEETAQ